MESEKINSRIVNTETLNKPHLLVILGSELEVAVDLGLARKVFELRAICERFGQCALVLNLQHVAQPNMHLIDQVDVQLAEEMLQ